MRGPCAPSLVTASILAGVMATAFAHASSPPRRSDDPPTTADLPEVRVDRDDVRITQSCRLIFSKGAIRDANGNGVVQVEGDGLVVDLGGGTLMGSADGAAPWTRDGIGISVRGQRVTLRNGAVRGFRVGVLAHASNGLTARDLDLSSNYGAQLKSTSAAEDGGDWLWPHQNDAQEWRTRYGAALCIEVSDGCTVERVRAVGGGAQNGIILDRVNDSAIRACDCSFLSGWGLAMWRSSGNEITRNAFDFCVRGYSHGVYNRGQDSAGILMFEQCSNNLIAINSVTHGGDGIFIFAGAEALGADLPPGADANDAAAQSSRGKGCNGNQIIGNDFSDAVAHGIELTFSFDNVMAFNTLRGCGISGTWGGYSQRMKIIGNVYESNGSATNPGEEGGVSTEHAADFLIAQNSFRDQGVAVKLWWDEDAGLQRKAWALANGHACRDNTIAGNTFLQCRVGVQLRGCDRTQLVDNTFNDVGTPVSAEPPIDASVATGASADRAQEAATLLLSLRDRIAKVPGTEQPIGARAALAGRDKIVMTERGPFDWKGSLLVFDRSENGIDTWRLLGDAPFHSATIHGPGGARLGGGSGGKPISVYASMPGLVIPYELNVLVADATQPIRAKGTLLAAEWNATFFAWTIDPRADLDGWRREGALGDHATLQEINLRYEHGGPSQFAISEDLRSAGLPSDHFGMIARTEVEMPAGRYRFRVLSDDGVRLRADGKTLIERWDWHGPTQDAAEFVVEQRRKVALELEHFEIDGFSVLTLSVELIEPLKP